MSAFESGPTGPPGVANPQALEVLVSDPNGSVLTVGDGKAFFGIPDHFDGLNLIDADAFVTTRSSSGLPTIQIRRVRNQVSADMLSTRITIDANEDSSYTAAVPPVIDGANDDVLMGDLIAVDVDGAGTGTKGLIVVLTFG